MVDKSYARLGIFLMVALVVMIGTALFFIHRMQKREVIDMVTYTTGNVTGLDVGSPVRFRGVPVGSVEELRVNPSGSLIEVDFEAFIDRLSEVGADVGTVRRKAAAEGFANFRAQIVKNPVTGEAYLFIDIPPNPPPPLELPFTPKRVYIPFMPTTLSAVEDRLPALLDRAVATLQTLENIVARLPATMDRSDRFFASLERTIRETEMPALSADTRRFFSATLSQMELITSNLDKSLGPGGTLAKLAEDTRAAIAAADLQGTNQATRDAMSQTSMAADDLRRSLPAMRDALAQLRDLARLLEEQPEAVLYGARTTKVKK
jgi:paraquat-inducible protein B